MDYISTLKSMAPEAAKYRPKNNKPYPARRGRKDLSLYDKEMLALVIKRQRIIASERRHLKNKALTDDEKNAATRDAMISIMELQIDEFVEHEKNAVLLDGVLAEHSDEMAKYINKHYSFLGEVAKKIFSESDYAGSMIRLENRRKTPHKPPTMTPQSHKQSFLATPSAPPNEPTTPAGDFASS